MLGGVGSLVGKIGVGEMIGAGMGLYFGAEDYAEQRREGASKVGAAMHAVGDFTVATIAPTFYMTSQLLSAAPGAAIGAYKMQREYRRNLANEQQNKPFGTANFMDTQQNYTMRQAGMAIAQQSNYATRSAMLGNEARFMAR